MIYVTRGLVDVALEMAAEDEPDSVTLVLSATPAGEFEADLGLDPTTPVLSHFYLPDVGQSVDAVFGFELGTPVGRGRARFVSHPQGPPEPTRRDPLAAVVLVAVPPWEEVAAFDRAGNRLDLEVLDHAPPEETFAHG